MILTGNRNTGNIFKASGYVSESPVTGTTRRGFTLVELIIVIFIISMTAALIMPSLWDRGERALKTESRRISNTLRFIHDEALGKKLTYNLKINLDKDEWGYGSDKESRNFTLKDDVMFRDIIVPSHGEVSSGELIIPFGPLGPEEPIIFHVMKNEMDYTITFNHITGKPKVYEGYRK